MRINNLISITCIVTLVALLCSCQHVSIKGDGTPDKHGQPETIHGSYYGFNWSDFHENKTKNNNITQLIALETLSNSNSSVNTKYSL